MVIKVTMQQIADHLGVSKFAVSKALSGKPGVSAETRDKIVSVATQLGYFVNKQTNTAAKRNKPSPFITNTRDTVILLVPKVRFQTRDSYFWGRIIDGVTEELADRDISALVVTENFKDNFSNLINPNGVLGIIGVGYIASKMLLEIRNLGIPFVLVDHEDPLIPSDVLFMNNMECTRRVTNYLIGCGHTKLQFVGNTRYSRSFVDRYIGYRTMMEEHGLPLNQEEGLLTFEGGNRSEITEALEVIVKELVNEHRLPTAFVCANDSIAICMMTVLGKLSVQVPGQCSVTGFDNIEDAAWAKPTLSTVNVQKEAIGRRAVEMLLRRLEHPDSLQEKILLAGEFIIRESTALPVGG
ncbi:LacI family DNA-binding transcriptional regulator [Paenibacillus sp. ATY16]|uniref:LacI family DNA-binding transcriptional regulator n=1 Tax=Paenibacillus sp. ATY16 TaxID=1759312 RepID=UPI00200E524E|nr:LacI family DNA-binding transcriptional regulator [Paenibacillus sp. ATY16]MCK9859597.1 LacI family DNA-binding transcriptional regulator [Paenibacillus sp. ATY16]